jgi:hypothetical protein
MKRLIFILATCVAGCAKVGEPAVEVWIVDSAGERHKQVTIGDCQYIQSYGSHGEKSLCHKGDCSNEIHKWCRCEAESTK